MVVAVVMMALALGFLAGFLAFKAKGRWCPNCGVGMRCIYCEEVRSGASHPAGKA